MADNSFTHLVVVGSSAGGIGALSGLVSSLPEEFDAPIVVAQHLDPNRESHLQEILARRSPLPVKTVTEHEPLQAGVVFVVPANRHVNITDSEIDLSSEPSSGPPMPSINLLMETAAGVFGENLIAVVLSGTGTDGTEGARTVSQAGGTVIIQDPETAEFGEMPRSLAPSTVDIVSTLGKIGPVLKNLISGIAVPEESSEDEGRALDRFLEELHRNRGVDFRSYKRPTILRRLGRRMAATDCESLDEYSRYVEEHPEEYGQLIGAFLIKVTEFFRDPELFDYLREEVLPGLVEEAREGENQLRIWSAGCATGEEAYSLAILVSEVIGREAGLFDVRIFATDIDEDAVKFARRGVYPPSALKGLSEEQIGRYFVDEDGSYQVKKQIRGMIVFGEHDLAQRSPFPHVDLVVSRNVLIYFSGELQRRALQLFAYSLRDGGYLVMGKAESPSLMSNLFAPVDRHNKVYRRHGRRFLLPTTLPTSPAPRARPERSSGDRDVLRGRPEAQQQLPAASLNLGEDLINQLPVGVAVVARDYTIEAINAAARQMLSIPSVGVGQDFLHAMQDVPYAEVRRTIDETFREARTTQAEEFAVEQSAAGESTHLRLTCYPRRTEVEGQRSEERARRGRRCDRSGADAAARGEEPQARRGQPGSWPAQRGTAGRPRGVAGEYRGGPGLGRRGRDAQRGAPGDQRGVRDPERGASGHRRGTEHHQRRPAGQGRGAAGAGAEQGRGAPVDEEGRRRAEGLVDQLQSERSRLEAILVDISDAVLAVDADGQVLFSNQVFEDTFGEHTEGEHGLLGSTEVLDERGEKLPADATPQSRAAVGESFAMRFVVLGNDGTIRRFEAKVRAIEGDSITGGVLVIREVTDGHD